MITLRNLRRLLLTVIASSLTASAMAEDVVIPTTDEHPFDLTKGIVTSTDSHEHFTQNGLEWMRNGDNITFSLLNEEELDACNVYVGADTGYSNIVSLTLNLKNESDEVVTDTTFQIENKGWYNAVVYSLQVRQLKKGHYTLTLTFHQTYNNSWYSCNISSIAFKKPQSLKPGDEVELQNPEFDNSYNGWSYQGHLWYTPEDYGNKYSLAHFNGGSGVLSQTIYNLPDGVYAFCLNAYDSYPNLDVAPDTYVFMNDRMAPMKTAYDDAISYRNIWRWYGKENGNYRHTPDGRWAPTHQVDWNESLAMAKQLYENCVVATVTNGQATFGWKKTDSRSVRIVCDHARLIFLSNDVTQQFDEATLRISHLRERLSGLERDLRTELAAKRLHAPQAVAEANAFINADIAYTSDNEYIDAILHAEHLLQRLQLPFYEVTVPDGSPSGLSSQLEALGIQTTDTIALKLNGTLCNDDLATLKNLKNIMELDLSETTLTALPDEQFNNRLYLLTWVTLPNQLESIGQRTFYDCVELRDMRLPATLKSIGWQAFRYGFNLNCADIPEGVTVENEVYRNSGIRSIVLPRSMRTVPYAICNGCFDLKDIRFNGQAIIDASAFSNCTALTTITIPEGVEWLNNDCFRECTNLTNATLPSTLVTVSSPFFNCHKLKTVTCLTVAPPYPQGSSLHGDIGSNGCTLRVPRWSVADYQKANRWNEFNVVPIDSLPATITAVSHVTIDNSDGQAADYKPDVNLTLLCNYWGGRVSGLISGGALTVNGSSILSTGHYTQLYHFFDCYNNGEKRDFFGALVNNGQMRADQVTIDMRLYPNQWVYASFPFDARISDIDVLVDGISRPLSEVPLVIYGYDCTKRAEGDMDGAWVRMTADSTLHAGRGYIWQTALSDYMAQARVPRHQILVNAAQNANKPLFFRNDNVEVKLDRIYSEFAHNRSWNFIGNPYPSFFDISFMDTTSPIIVWEYNGHEGHYVAYSPLDDPYILNPGQAFFIQRPLDQESVIFFAEGRQVDMTFRQFNIDESRTKARAQAAVQPRQVFNLFLAPLSSPEGDTIVPVYDGNEAPSGAVGGALDRTRFVINEAAMLDYEPGRDAAKFDSPDARATEFYILRDGVRYAIDERPFDEGIVHLGLKVATEGTYTLSLGLSPSGEQEGGVTLIDLATGIETDLTKEGYTFTAAAGIVEGRFLIRLGGSANGIQPIANESQQMEQLFDLQGRPISHPQKGLYIQNNKKVIIK